MGWRYSAVQCDRGILALGTSGQTPDRCPGYSLLGVAVHSFSDDEREVRSTCEVVGRETGEVSDDERDGLGAVGFVDNFHGVLQLEDKGDLCIGEDIVYKQSAIAPEHAIVEVKGNGVVELA